MKPLYWKILLILGAVIVGASLIIPKALRKNALVGMDDVPHTELILEVDDEYLLQDLLSKEARKLQNSIEKNNIKGSVRQKSGAIVVGFRSNKYYEQGAQLLDNLPVSFDGTAAKNLTVSEIKNRLFKVQFTPAYLGHVKQIAIDETYTEITDRVKISNADAAKMESDKIRFRYVESNDKRLALLIEQIRNPIYLSFHEVIGDIDQSKLTRCIDHSICPQGTSAYEQVNGYGYLVLRDEAILSGADLKGAADGLHPFSSYPVLNFSFKANGAKKFCEFTSSNINELFAVVINNEIITAPNIAGSICGGSSFIEGNFTMESAKDLALRLNAGTLPTKMRVVEERVVVPAGTAETQK